MNSILLILILILLVTLIGLTVYQLFNKDIQEKMINVNNPSLSPISQVFSAPPRHLNPILEPDPIMIYDYRKAFDPLLDPTRRVPRHELPTLPFKRMIDYPTRGFPDNFTQTGLLITDSGCKKCGKNKKNKSNNCDNCDNRILRLFSRQEFPGSNRYEYYTMVSSGNDQIKIPICNKRRDELYDGDNVYIEELNNKYRVKLLKYDAPRYYPDVI